MRLAFFPTVVICASIVVWCGHERAFASNVTQSFAVEKYRLPNGLEVILQSDRSLPLVAVNLWIGGGGKDDTPERSGFAHLFEHLLFEGSAHIVKKTHDFLIPSLGGIEDGRTTSDRTALWAVVPSQHLESVLWLRSDEFGFLLGPQTPRVLMTQKQVVINEYRQIHDTPYATAILQLWEMLFPLRHPYHHRIIGAPQAIEQATIDDVTRFYRTYYVPNNASLVIAGDFEPAHAHKLVDKYFSTIPGPCVLPAQIGKIQAPLDREMRVSMKDRVATPKLFFAWMAPPPFSSDDASVELLSDILGGDDSGLLSRRLVNEQHVAKKANCWHWPGSLGSVLVCELTPTPNVSAQRLELAFDEVLDMTRNRGVSATDLSRQKNQRRSLLLHQMESLRDRAELLNRYNRFVHDPNYLEHDLARYDAVSPDVLQAAARKWLDPHHRAVILVEPEAR